MNGTIEVGDNLDLLALLARLRLQTHFIYNNQSRESSEVRERMQTKSKKNYRVQITSANL